jgi:hypothetical protein
LIDETQKILKEAVMDVTGSMVQLDAPDGKMEAYEPKPKEG